MLKLKATDEGLTEGSFSGARKRNVISFKESVELPLLVPPQHTAQVTFAGGDTVSRGSSDGRWEMTDDNPIFCAGFILS
ncbi:hypothetical protein U1Q18_019195 [Sarracenia purpurea var. burkii]